eukprot:5334184-Prymnesium_polylepis.2
MELGCAGTWSLASTPYLQLCFRLPLKTRSNPVSGQCRFAPSGSSAHHSRREVEDQDVCD